MDVEVTVSEESSEQENLNLEESDIEDVNLEESDIEEDTMEESGAGDDVGSDPEARHWAISVQVQQR